MRLIYIAGPYRAPTPWGRHLNIERARAYGAILPPLGVYPMIPHSNTAHMDGIADDEVFLEGTMEMLRRCDGALFIPRWEQSSGARAEQDLCLTMCIPFCSVGLLTPQDATPLIKEWLKDLHNTGPVEVRRCP